MAAPVPDIADLFAAHYLAGGRGPQHYDCFGLFAEVCRRRGAALPDEPTPAAVIDRAERIAAGAADGWVEIDQPEPWCAVAIRIGPWVSHLGTVLADRRHFLHASEGTGVSVELLAAPRWQKRIAGFYRHV